MKQEILDRIQALGGDISQVKGTSLAEDLSAITFNTILYEKPEDTAWARADEEEPIYLWFRRLGRCSYGALQNQ